MRCSARNVPRRDPKDVLTSAMLVGVFLHVVVSPPGALTRRRVRWPGRTHPPEPQRFAQLRLIRVRTYLTHTRAPATLRAWNTTPAAPETLVDAIRYFSDPDICLSFMVQLRWPDGASGARSAGATRCPSSRLADSGRAARSTRAASSPPRWARSSRIRPLGLDKWFAAMWMIASDKNGISSYEVARALDHSEVRVVHDAPDPPGHAGWHLRQVLGRRRG